MIKITFKNVGQGDSIVLEWEKESVKKVGILDCNLFKNQNPVLEYLKFQCFKEIEFLILSHPHYDHFSGIQEVLEYCDQNNIIIKKFFHTCQQVPDYLRVATRSVISSNALVELFLKIQELFKKQIIQFQTYISDEINDLTLNNDLRLCFLAPSSVEYEKFLRNTPLFDDEDPHNNSQSNWLSTILKIYTSEWYVLLTSDSPIETLKRVGIQRKGEFNSKLKLGQSPHHGAKKNHYDAFWKTKKHETKTPIIFSVGDNIYDHPSAIAVEFFSDLKNDFKIYSTNQVGALSAFISDTKSKTIDAYLDLIGSEKINPATLASQYQGDKSFSF